MTLGTSFHRYTRHWRFCFLVALPPCGICSLLPSVPAQARRAALFPVLASWVLGSAKFACLQRQKPAMFAQTPLFVYRHFTGAVCTTSSDGRFALFRAPSIAAFSVASRLSNPSDILLRTSSEPLTAVGCLMRASVSKAAGSVGPWLRRANFWRR